MNIMNVETLNPNFQVRFALGLRSPIELLNQELSRRVLAKKRPSTMSDSESNTPDKRRSQREKKTFKPFASSEFCDIREEKSPLTFLQSTTQSASANAPRATQMLFQG